MGLLSPPRVLRLAAALLPVLLMQPRPAPAKPVAIGRLVTHPDGASLRLNSIEFDPGAIILSVTLANPGSREIRLNKAGSFVLDEGAHVVHRLNPPFDNPELRIPPQAQVTADLVFIGPLSPAAPQLVMSSNEGVGTPDNPYDEAPVFRAALPVERENAAAGEYQASHPDGVTLRVWALAFGPDRCAVSVRATNGNDRTIVLNQDDSLMLSDDRGRSAPVNPPTENAELVVPPANRLDAELVFDCHALAPAGRLMLGTNRGTAGTADNPYDTLPVLSLSLPAQRSPEAANVPANSHAVVAPIARSRFAPPEIASGTDAHALALPPSLRLVPPRPAPAPPAPAAEPAPAAVRPPAAAPPPEKPADRSAEQAPMTRPQLEAALHAAPSGRGLRVVLPADQLFAAAQGSLDAAGGSLLANLAALVAAEHPRIVVVDGHTDASGNDEGDLALSRQRAQAVADWLAAHAPRSAPRFVERGYGRTRPLAPNHKADGSDNPAGRAQNRRIEITLQR